MATDDGDSSLSLQELMRLNPYLIACFLAVVISNRGPHPPAFYDERADDVLARLKRDVDREAYRTSDVESGQDMIRTRRDEDWDVKHLIKFLFKNNMLATRGIPHDVRRQVNRNFEGGVSAQWREAVEYGKDERAWDATIPSHKHCTFDLGRSDEERKLDPEASRASSIDYGVTGAGMRVIQCSHCNQRLYPDQVELHPRHQQALFAILVIDFNRFMDEEILASVGVHEPDQGAYVDTRWTSLFKTGHA